MGRIKTSEIMALVILQTGKFPTEEYKINQDQIRYLRKLIQTMQEENEGHISPIQKADEESQLSGVTFQQLLLDEK
ncbi:MAG: hypothetical protein ACI85I_001236 [Arenicella sp.]